MIEHALTCVPGIELPFAQQVNFRFPVAGLLLFPQCLAVVQGRIGWARTVRLLSLSRAGPTVGVVVAGGMALAAVLVLTGAQL